MVRVLRPVKFFKGLVDLPVDTEYLIIPKSEIKDLAILEKGQVINLSDEALKLELAQLKGNPTALFQAPTPDYTASSPYFEGCAKKFNTWLS